MLLYADVSPKPLLCFQMQTKDEQKKERKRSAILLKPMRNLRVVHWSVDKKSRKLAVVAVHVGMASSLSILSVFDNRAR